MGQLWAAQEKNQQTKKPTPQKPKEPQNPTKETLKQNLPKTKPNQKPK